MCLCKFQAKLTTFGRINDLWAGRRMTMPGLDYCEAKVTRLMKGGLRPYLVLCKLILQLKDVKTNVQSQTIQLNTLSEPQVR